ncbi:type I secretion system permease/ATPase [Aurantimonas sp. Leaf443]|uniref:type I secretion system permease/ATPase n=1 Tax=Aurantimonas sp. Leaf443 TaxID=1736378 RepID=UPI000AF2EFF1|nr:type I secretion system permease/ATPase [Aurantimonas sp. Leaf443]
MRSELSICFAKCRKAFVAVAALSGVANVLALTGSIFMLAVYDRVIPSGSIPSLVALGLFALALYVFQGGVDILRSRMLTRIGLMVKESFGARTFDTIVRNAASGNQQAASAVRDLDQVRTFLSSQGPTAIFDLPWIPLYLLICFLFHFYIGLAVLVGALVLIAITYVSNIVTKQPSKELNDVTNKRAFLLAACQSNAETLQSMGMTLAMSGNWNRVNGELVEKSLAISDKSNSLGTVSRVARMVLQSGVLALGAYLVITQQATGGVMIASSILSARALAPIELAIAHWKNLVAARQSWARLDELFIRNPPERAHFSTPAPSRQMTCEMVSVAPPNIRKLIVRDVSFLLKAGEGLGIIGSTGSGKSTLVRALVGLWNPALGTVRLDGIAMSQWSSTERGKFVGYLPQNVALFEGTIAQNIARFDPNADSGMIVNVARAAGVHDMIVRLPDGYDTMISDTGGGLSGGQSQRIGLARALYGDPFLVVLDEPNSNLDNEGELALQSALEGVKARGGIVIIVAHRPSILSTVNQVLILNDGRVQKYGPRDEVLELFSRRAPAVGAVTAA